MKERLESMRDEYQGRRRTNGRLNDEYRMRMRERERERERDKDYKKDFDS